MAEKGRDQWILTPEEYADLPAFKSTTLEKEMESRRQASELIQKLGAKIKLYVISFDFQK